MVYHVRDVLDSTRPTLPPPARTSTDDIIARAGRIRRRRVAAAGGAAAAVAIAALGVGLADRPGDNEILTAAPAGPGFSTVYGEYRTGPNQIGPIGQITSGYQELPVYRDGLTWQDDQGREYPMTDGAIRFYQPGVFDPATLGADESGATFGPAFTVRIGGVPGTGRIMTYAGQGTQYRRTALAWQYEPDAWATYVPRAWKTSDSTEDAVRIAGAVRPTGRTQQVRVPYRMTFVPPGWQTVSAEEATTRYSNVVSDVFLHAGPLTGAARGTTVDLRMNGITIVVMRGEPKDRAIRGKDGVHCYTSNVACTIVKGDYLIDVDGRSSGLPAKTLRRMVDGIEPADLADHDSWLPVTR